MPSRCCCSAWCSRSSRVVAVWGAADRGKGCRMTQPPQDPWARPPDAPRDGVTQPPPASPPAGSTQTYSPAPYAPYGTGPTTAGRNGLGTAALVVGIVGLLFSWTVVLGLALGVLGIVFGVIGRRRADRGEATNKGQATAGLILGSIATLVAVVFIGIFAWLWSTPAAH